MRANEAWYKPFIDVNPGGGRRRNPKRKNVGASSSDFTYAGPTEAQVHAAWEAHLDRMSCGGTYGDNMEIRAFTKAYNTDVMIFTQNNANYSITASDDEVERPVAYIAYHVSLFLS
jgi:OTU domain-containing protein 3